MDINEILSFLKNYDGKELTFMEVCGTHTASISENGIPSLLSSKINLVSGPGCPVCVTVQSYIDRLVELSLEPNRTVVTFGDMIRVPGTKMALKDSKAIGGSVKMVYSPFEIIDIAEEEPQENFVFAAVGFETTTPIYALLLEEIIKKNINNIQFLTALKTMPEAIEYLSKRDNKIDGFIAPGHVAVITGANIFKPLAEKYNIPFVVSGFRAEELIATIYALVKLNSKGVVKNLYKSAVTDGGNENAKKIVNKYFEKADAAWRGLGIIEKSGMALKDEYKKYDAGSRELVKDTVSKNGCRCGEVISGLIKPNDCPLFRKVCNPENPKGACMVSNEGSCFHYFLNNRG